MDANTTVDLKKPHKCFTKDHDKDDAARLFEREYGTPPQYNDIVVNGLLWVGPIPPKQAAHEAV